MMTVMRCFDTAKEAIDGFLKEHNNLSKTDRERLDMFTEYCDAVDLIADYNRAECVAFKVEDDGAVSCKLMLPALDTPSAKSPFFDLVVRSVSFSVENVDGKIVLTFVFPSLWEENPPAERQVCATE